MADGIPLLNREKMQQVVLFFLEKINNVHLGRTKLMKLLYYVDFDHFEKYGTPVTGARYRKLPHGPVPDKADQVIAEMERTGLVKAVEVEVGPYAQDRLITQSGQFDPTKFSGDELSILEAVASRWEHASAKEIERATHREAPWASTEDTKAIDYELAEYRSPLPEDEIDLGLAESPLVRDFLAREI
jgi:uncharacterized phage-associated protein